MASASLPSNREKCCEAMSLCSISVEMQEGEGSLAAKSPSDQFHSHLQQHPAVVQKGPILLTFLLGSVVAGYNVWVFKLEMSKTS